MLLTDTLALAKIVIDGEGHAYDKYTAYNISLNHKTSLMFQYYYERANQTDTIGIYNTPENTLKNNIFQ